LSREVFFDFHKQGMQRQDFLGYIFEALWRVFARLVDFPCELSKSNNVADTVSETHGDRVKLSGAFRASAIAETFSWW
jgi:hypothetical protein